MPPPRRRRWPWVLLAVVVVLAGLLVAADRIALQWAEDKAASSLQSSQDLANKPDVSVAGFPFLTQLMDRRFPDVTVTDTDLQLDSGLTVDRLTVHLHDVTVDSGYTQVNAARAEADALIGYDALSRALRMRISTAGGDRLIAHPRIAVGGRSWVAPVTARVRTVRDSVHFTDVTVAGAQVPRRIAHLLDRAFATNLSVAGLPFHIRLTGAEVTDAGVVLRLAGRELSYQR
jgi:hypothetical protein